MSNTETVSLKRLRDKIFQLESALAVAERALKRYPDPVACEETLTEIARLKGGGE